MTPNELANKILATQHSMGVANLLIENLQMVIDALRSVPPEALGEAADGGCASLKVVEIPDGTDYEIGEYDGMEHVAEKHRTWG